MRILLADDSEIVRRSIGSALEGWGFDVVCAADGTEALKHLLTDASLRIAILDWQMPGMDGPDVCARLRSADNSRYVYVLVLTAATDGQSVLEALNKGADDYMLKAAPRAELEARLKAGARIVELQQRLINDAQRLAQAQRMESVGNLASGISHELNTPIQYVSHNVEFVAEEIEKLVDHLNRSPVLLPGVDIEFLGQELVPACRETLTGLSHIKSIVDAIRDFSSSSACERNVTSLNSLVSAASALCRNEWVDIAELKLELAPEEPLLMCIPQDIQQVALQLILNAIQAIQARPTPRGRSNERIQVCTALEGELVRLSVSDTGCGIPEEIRSRVFDPFFSTREVGSGRGAGLALVYSAVVERHGGTISFDSQIGEGTVFHVVLPTGGKRQAASAVEARL